jgi:hypothetical protein
MVITCEINFDENQTSFYAGEEVSGYIEYNASEETIVESESKQGSGNHPKIERYFRLFLDD